MHLSKDVALFLLPSYFILPYNFIFVAPEGGGVYCQRSFAVQFQHQRSDQPLSESNSTHLLDPSIGISFLRFVLCQAKSREKNEIN